MPAAFIHLSDIHFGQERGSRVIIHDDVKERLIEDVAKVVAELPGRRATGLLVVGDVAFAGKPHEYITAGKWLDRVAQAAGCTITDIQVVPGNHDIDRELISPSMRLMIDDMVKNGVDKLEAYLGNESDRETIYQRFQAYRSFAEGYDCPLDCFGHYAADRRVELAEGRSIRFARINSALLCHSKEEPGHLLLGARQWVLPQASGEELVVLCHHPLNWFGDQAEAARYIRARARAFISGHEHQPSVNYELMEDGRGILMLASGAAIPPKAEDKYNFTYNVLEFDWERAQDALAIRIHPRAWNATTTRFEEDPNRLGGPTQRFIIPSPNFRAVPQPVAAPPGPASPAEDQVEAVVKIELPAEVDEGEREGRTVMAEDYQLILLRFFRDLSEGQRLSILAKVGALPGGLNRTLTQSLERRLLDAFIAREGTASIRAAIAEALAEREDH